MLVISDGDHGYLGVMTGNSACYVRSDHLDALTWLFIEAGSATARQVRALQHYIPCGALLSLRRFI